jgi:hypothetical protein
VGGGDEARGNGGFFNPAARSSISGEDSSVKTGMLFVLEVVVGSFLWLAKGQFEMSLGFL